jgi:S-adenosylmethionine:tRNA ribosyltransferase-isomerase
MVSVSDFDFLLPDELIAQYPAQNRTDSCLLCVDGKTGEHHERCFADLGQVLLPGDLLVLNDTRVVKARLIGHKITGGRVELLLERVLDESRVLAFLKASNAPRPGAKLVFNGVYEATVLRRIGAFYELQICGPSGVTEVLQECGAIPLPPYIRRKAEKLDVERYQTVYARASGAVAAPTAGLHFDEPLLSALRAQGVQLAFITLHVGAGTFQPVRAEDLRQHRLHSEYMEVSNAVCQQVEAVQRQGGRVIAVGTTVVRALESAADGYRMHPFKGETDLFIYPGYRFRCVDAMITNFHLPRSSLLMLVCAFAGHHNVLRAYHYAITHCLRFYSYGDAMFVTRSIP